MPALLWSLLLLFGLGALLPTGWAWGFNHLAFLPPWAALAWLGLAAISLLPPLRRPLGVLMERSLPALLAAHPGPWLAATAAGLVCFAYPTDSTLLGDGGLILDMLRRGIPFRGFDNLDYFLHQAAYAWWFAPRGLEPLLLYRITSALGGAAAVLAIGLLVRRLPVPPWRRSLLLVLLLGGGHVLLYFGYVESYTWLQVWLTAFLLAGLLTLAGRLPLWTTSLLLGLALCCHLSAVLALPSLLVPAVAAPGIGRRRRWLEALGPVVLLAGAAAGIQVPAGYDSAWAGREFLPDEAGHGFLAPLLGPGGVLSAAGAGRMVNWWLLASPVGLALTLAGGRQLWARRREPALRFLGLHVVLTTAAALLVDWKLGPARDWDLFIAHTGSLPLLGALAMPAGERAAQLAGRAALTALLLTVPWIVLQHDGTAATERFRQAAGTFAAYPRAYAFESLAQLRREEGNLPEAVALYEQCVAARPGNARFHTVLGSAYAALAGQEASPARTAALRAAAEASYRRALALDEGWPSVRKNLAMLLVQQDKWAEAVPFLERLAHEPGAGIQVREALAYCLVQEGRGAEAAPLVRELLRDPEATALTRRLAVGLGLTGN